MGLLDIWAVAFAALSLFDLAAIAVLVLVCIWDR